nr:RHS repeat-associated core domain-containing protein [Chloroflexota bacterium]
MRTNDTLNYLVGDHLGSTSLVTDSAGVKINEQRYKAWGETRYTFGNDKTKYQYTGQFSYTADFGLYFYNARWYDPALGRFAQADSIIPQNQGIQAWDRYAYANNNPVRYNDPTGHCIRCVIGVAAVALAGSFVLSAVGATPDYLGVATTMALTNTNDAVVAAGLAVQSQYLWALVGDTLGWAQAKPEELAGENPFSPAVAVKVMNKRINGAIDDHCKLCHDGNKDGVDKLIVAALAQNGFDFSPQGVGDAMSQDNIDWKEFLATNGGNPSAWYAEIRQDVTNQNYDTQLMLNLFIKDLRLLMSVGYDLPVGITETDIKYIEDNYLSNQDERR